MTNVSKDLFKSFYRTASIESGMLSKTIYQPNIYVIYSIKI